ncbi:hypothetical protein [Labilibaculum euxinus]
MIKEIVQFTEALSPETFSKNLQLKEGLYLFLDVQEENGEAILKNVDTDGKLWKEDFGVFTKKTEMNPFFEECLELQISSLPVSPAKIFNPNKKIYGTSCSPFALGFIKKNFVKHDKKLLIKELCDQYLKKAEKYCTTNEQKEKFRLFRNYLTSNLYELVTTLKEYNSAKDSFSVNVYLKHVSKEDFVQVHELYLKENVFNKDDYNETVNEEIFGISDSLSGFNDKKRFLKHQTSSLKYNYRIKGEEAQSLWKFFKLQQNKQLPNPLPVFVDQDELNGDSISIHQGGEVLTYSNLIKSLLDKHKRDVLQNFYLIFFQGIKGSRIADIDFVPQFKYKVEERLKLIEVFQLGGKFAEHQIKNIFQFQNLVFNKIFNNQLVTKTKNGLWVKYFDDIEPNPKYYFTDAICDLMMQYRKVIYDYVYKAKYESITCKIFDRMMVISILEDIRIDDDYQRGYSIKEKLNLWFSLYNYFSQNKNRENMANKTVELRTELKTIIENENLNIESDSQFAFASGQLIWKILIQSKSANRSHALLEPFLQKTNVEQFKLAIAKTFDMYKHEFTLYSKKYGFDKLMGDVMGFAPEEKNMKNLLTYILAGYFSDSIL